MHKTEDASAIQDLPDTLELADLLSRLAEECTRITLQVDRLQDLAAGLVMEARRDRDPSVIREMQSLDHLTQTAAALAAVLNHLAQTDPEGQVVRDAVSSVVTLGGLADRLTGTRTSADEDDGSALFF